MSRGVVELPPAHLGIAIYKDPLPRHLHTIKVHQGIVLVVAKSERVIEFRYSVLFIRFARQNFQSRDVHWHCKRYGVIHFIRAQRLQMRNKHLVGHDGTGTEHLCPAHRNPFTVFINNLHHRIIVLKFDRRFRPIDLGIDDHVSEIQIVIAGVDIVVPVCFRPVLIVVLEQVQAHQLSGYSRSHVIR